MSPPATLHHGADIFVRAVPHLPRVAALMIDDDCRCARRAGVVIALMLPLIESVAALMGDEFA